ncbi:MAG: DNA recombination protein RmuC [Candidatus Wildermuthbacteria bacterium]|nr:DNA recombination protein RmuC [Candidatus Wildermuthbacteria bacterium]
MESMIEAILIGIIVVLAIAVFFLILQKIKQPESSNFLMIQNQLQDLRKTVDQKLGMSSAMFQQQFKQSANIIKEVTEKLTRLDETNKQVLNFSDQLQHLQDILKNPKQRGVLGEYYLETVLKNVLPPESYKMQYEFKDGTMVDAAIFVKNKIIPIDSKFSLENYNRIVETRDEEEKERFEKIFKQDLKTRIDETSKYVKPQEGTMDFAFMFIPAEAVFYDLLVNKVGAVETQDLIQYAINEKHVIIVSPTSFLAYLQTVLQGLRALQIEESAKEIRKKVEDLGRHIGSYETYMKKLGNHLGTTVNTYNTAYKELGKIDKDVLKISGKSNEVEALEIDRPKTEEEQG